MVTLSPLPVSVFFEDGQKVKLMEQPAEKEDFEIKKAE